MRTRTKWLASSGLFVALLALGEAAVRVFRRPTYLYPEAHWAQDPWRTAMHQRSAVPGLAYELRPGSSGTYPDVSVVVNSIGLRGPEPVEPRPARSLRIAAIGDSVTFGLGVEESATWPRELERVLRAERPDLRVEVENYGVCGYTTVDESLVLEAKALARGADVVVVGYCLNDPELVPTQGLTRYFSEPELWHHSALLRLVASTFRERGIRASGGLIPWLHEPDGAPWAASSAALDRMRRACAERGVPVLVAVFPTFAKDESWADYRWSAVHGSVVAAAEQRGFAALDLLPAFVARGGAPSAMSVDEWHGSPEGLALAARAIAGRMLAEPERWLAARPR